MDYYKYLEALPEDVREIVMQFYDETGRPSTINPKNDIVIALLYKNSATTGEQFIEELLQVFPYINKEEAAIYYNVFISGAKWLKSKLIG